MKYKDKILIAFTVLNVSIYAVHAQGNSNKDSVAENMLVYQRAIGGWPKAIKEVKVDYNKPLSEDQKTAIKADSMHIDATIDNNATFREISYLVKAYRQTNNKAYLRSAEKGIRYLLKAQDANGGWPQYFPDASLYRSAITFNDNAMINTMTILNNVAQRSNGFDSVDPALVRPAETAVNKGIDCILKTQILAGGKLTAWNQQYDKDTLKPVMARKFELIGLATSESADIVEFLMHVKHPSPQVKKSIKEAVEWFNLVKITGYNFKHISDPNQAGGKDAIVVADPNSTIWARYYEIGTNKPFFTGRDSIKKYNLTEIENERRAGYAWYGTWPQKILTKDYSAWLKSNP